MNTTRWRQSIARYLLKESGVEVSWIDNPPEIRASRTLHSSEPLAGVWDINVTMHDDGRAAQLALDEQSPMAMLRVFGTLSTDVWAQRLLKIDE